MANTVNAALKPLETLSRIVNQPSSLFGGKGGSSKNKAEHDTVGTARDSNSNTQDQGIDMSPIRYFKILDPAIPVSPFLICIIYCRRAWWSRASGGQPQGAGNRQRPDGWRDGGRHGGHCRSAWGAQHTGYAGNGPDMKMRNTLIVFDHVACNLNEYVNVTPLSICHYMSGCEQRYSTPKRCAHSSPFEVDCIYISISVLTGREWAGGSDWWAVGERRRHCQQHNNR